MYSNSNDKTDTKNEKNIFCVIHINIVFVTNTSIKRDRLQAGYGFNKV